jgi:diaminopimelate dehydrogenase
MIRIAVQGLGNLGKYAIEAIEAAPDMECVGVIRRESSLGKNTEDLRGVQDYASIESLINSAGKPDVVILCSPSRNVYADAALWLKAGVCTVDSFDIHSEITKLLDTLAPCAEAAGKASISSAGWDPGTDSVFRAIFEAMAPKGSTFTNFGRGRSMGHSVAARAIQGVKDAVSITIPMGGGMHSRVVYVLPEAGEKIDEIRDRIKADSYFAKDPLQVIPVASADELDMVADASHGVLMERTGGYGSVSNQQLRFDMRINNPALTSQILTACARAVVRMPAGAHTMIDVPPIFLLPGDRRRIIERMV